MLCTTSYDYFRDAGCAPLHERLCRACGSTRGWSDCSAHVLLATGRIDAVVEPLLARWDISAVIAVIEAAGGRWSDYLHEIEEFKRRNPLVRVIVIEYSE